MTRTVATADRPMKSPLAARSRHAQAQRRQGHRRRSRGGLTSRPAHADAERVRRLPADHHQP